MTFWHDPQRQLVVHDVPEPGRVLGSVPGSVHLSNGYVASPTTLYNLQVLTWLGLPTPPPMEGRYDWPIAPPWKPLAHQKVMANFLALHPRCFNFSDMGTMKTLSILWAADYVMQQFPAGQCRALIVAPLSILERVWADAILKNFLARRTFVILHGDHEKRRDQLRKPADFYIINFDGLKLGAPKTKGEGRGLYQDLAERRDIRMAIVDEASKYRDASTDLHKAARAQLAQRDYLWLATGTPTPNGPTDAYGLAKLVNNAHGESFGSFRDRVMYRAAQFKWLPKVGAMAAARQLLSPAIRFAIEDCVDLPPCVVQQREVPFSAEQKTAYEEMKRDLQIASKSGSMITAANEAVLRLKLLQIAGGAIYDQNRDSHSLSAAPRIAALKEVIAETAEKIIVFAPLTNILHMLSQELSKDPATKGISKEIFNGEVSPKRRAEIVSAFQSGAEPRILLADPGTMAHGLTLTAATAIVWYCPTDKTEIYLQANKRIDRPGQTKSTTVVQLVSTPVEREIYRRLDNNQSMMGLILQMVKGG